MMIDCNGSASKQIANRSESGLPALSCRKKAEAQLRKILLKHFPADLGVKNGSRGYERAFREMLWASEASEPITTMLLDMQQF